MNNILLLSNCNGKMFKISKMQGNITLCRKQVKRGYFYSFFDIWSCRAQQKYAKSNMNVLLRGPSLHHWHTLAEKSGELNIRMMTEELKHCHPPESEETNRNWGKSSTPLADFSRICFKAKPHHKEPQTNVFNHSLGHMPTGNREYRNNCMFPFVSPRPFPSAAHWGFMTARIDPLHHHSVLTNDFKLAISGIMRPSEIQPSDLLQQAEPQETQAEKYC